MTKVNYCEAADLPNTPACQGALQDHHVKFRSRGGSNSRDNLATLCVAHHMWVHANSLDAHDVGLARWSWEPEDDSR